MSFPDEIKGKALAYFGKCTAPMAVKLLEKEILSMEISPGIKKYQPDDIPSERTVRRWWKKLGSKVNQSICFNSKPAQMTPGMNQHYRQLSRLAGAIVGDIGHIQAVGKSRFRVYTDKKVQGLAVGTLTRTELAEHLHCEMISLYNKNSALFDCLRQHLAVENSKCQDLAEYAQSSPGEVFKLLQLVALRKTFQGKCEICKDWQ